jgi:ABC-type transport system substrate-binding protein
MRAKRRADCSPAGQDRHPAKLQNVEWAQWLSGTYTNKNYDLTIISHVEPFDLGNFAKPDYYWGYQSQEFNELFDKIKHTPRPADRARLLGDAQRLLAHDSVHGFLHPAVGDRGEQEAARAVEGHAGVCQ